MQFAGPIEATIPALDIDVSMRMSYDNAGGLQAVGKASYTSDSMRSYLGRWADGISAVEAARLKIRVAAAS